MSSCKAPCSRSGEEVALGESSEVIRFHILDRSIIDNAWRDYAVFHQATDRLDGGGVDLVVVCRHVRRSTLPSIFFLHRLSNPRDFGLSMPRCFARFRATIFFSATSAGVFTFRSHQSQRS